MKKILIIGAAGQIARVATRELLARTDSHLTLFARDTHGLPTTPRERITLVRGDALDPEAVAAAVRGQDLVYVNLSGPLDEAARVIVDAMRAEGVRRLVFVSSMGIYDEIPGERSGAVLDPYRRAAAVVEGAGLDHTMIRPAWLDDSDEIAYGTTHRHEPFRNAARTVSRRSVADLLVRIVQDEQLGMRDSLGVHHT
ncbi:NAD(P)H-binding protein [uncultured Propionibacterium sp.]|uniref:NAD(P)H-binding protein n=1 Tax=uncultured Propionibacterium sp. TaxID=218066 RepID=UPI00292CC71F|nr:NAD(P)H-binding protein [uncultured Propionibacterium sp.]